jgi:hypothetical protein
MKIKEFNICNQIATALLLRFGSADEIPGFVARNEVMEVFGFELGVNGKVPVDVVELTDWVFQAARDNETENSI